jgi:hypothetical protein
MSDLIVDFEIDGPRISKLIQDEIVLRAFQNLKPQLPCILNIWSDNRLERSVFIPSLA